MRIRDLAKKYGMSRHGLADNLREWSNGRIQAVGAQSKLGPSELELAERLLQRAQEDAHRQAAEAGAPEPAASPEQKKPAVSTERKRKRRSRATSRQALGVIAMLAKEYGRDVESMDWLLRSKWLQLSSAPSEEEIQGVRQALREHGVLPVQSIAEADGVRPPARAPREDSDADAASNRGRTKKQASGAQARRRATAAERAETSRQPAVILPTKRAASPSREADLATLPAPDKVGGLADLSKEQRKQGGPRSTKRSDPPPGVALPPGLESQIQALAARVGPLERQVDALRSAIEPLDAQRARESEALLASVEQRLESLNELWQVLARAEQRLDALAKSLVTVEQSVQRREPWPAAFAQIEQRAKVLSQPRPTLSPFTWPEAAVVCGQLRQRHFVLAQPTAEALLRQLATSKLVVLRGPPGSGKSQLAKEIARAVLPSGRGDPFTFVSIDPEYGLHRLVGGLRKLGDHFGPSLGPLTEAVLRCYEGSPHWLVLDEINRGDANSLLTPLLDALSNADGTFEHAHMFPRQMDSRARLRLPHTFRILGTMNSVDEHLFEFSAALKRRAAMVDLGHIDAPRESELLLALLSRRIEVNAHDTAERARAHLESAEPTIRTLVEIATRVRALAANDPPSDYRYCAIGTGVLETVLGNWMVACLQTASGSEGARRGALDEAVAAVLVPQLEMSGVAALAAIRDDVLKPMALPHSVAAIDRSIRSREAF